MSHLCQRHKVGKPYIHNYVSSTAKAPSTSQDVENYIMFLYSKASVFRLSYNLRPSLAVMKTKEQQIKCKTIVFKCFFFNY